MRREGRGGPADGTPPEGAGDHAILAALAEISREHAARLTATMTRLLGDFDLAEESVQDALLAAIERWPRAGIPAQPGAWLLTVARRKAVDRLRRQAKYREKLALLQVLHARPSGGVSAEEHLRLVFTCCYPALSRAAQVALTLRAVMGLTTAQIASAFLCPEATIAQRIVRAKRKIVEEGIPYRVPDGPERARRLDGVLAVLYLVFNEGYLSSGGMASQRNLAEEAAWLVSLLARLMPDVPEILGLLALMRLHLARVDARFDEDGGLVVLRDQDRRRWDRQAIADADALIARAAAMRRPGPYQLQAAIAACHATADSWEATDWSQILALYGRLGALDPSPVVSLNRAIALWQVRGAELALAHVDALADALGRYHLFHATRGELLRALGRPAEARAADLAALALTRNPAERRLLRDRLGAPRADEET